MLLRVEAFLWSKGLGMGSLLGKSTDEYEKKSVDCNGGKNNFLPNRHRRLLWLMTLSFATKPFESPQEKGSLQKCKRHVNDAPMRWYKV